jgi:hypothetical protein
MLETRDNLKNTLKDCIVKVTFEKADGTMREMRCTLNNIYLPAQKVLAEGETLIVRKENLDVLSVWDVDVGGWRSFRMDSIKNMVIDTLIVR